jgi:hypothetical protein
VNPTFRTVLAVLSPIALPAALLAQSPVSSRVPPAASAPAASRDEMRSWVAELQQIGARLQGATERALRGDPRLRAAQDSLAGEIERAMEGVDPGLRRLADRAQALTGEAQRASEAGDQARLRALMEEADRIQARFQVARERVMHRPALAARVKAYEARLRERLRGEEPHLDQLLSRGTDLQQRLARMALLQRQMMSQQQRASAGAASTPAAGQARRPE